MLAAIKHCGKWICNECFNKLPSDERNGMGARPLGWAPAEVHVKKCDCCKRDAAFVAGPPR
jgi:hypothetical protein